MQTVYVPQKTLTVRKVRSLVVAAILASATTLFFSSAPSAAATKSFRMPKIVGLTYASANEKIKALGGYLDYIDVLSNRSVWDEENWTVVKQSPSPGTRVTTGDKICAGVAKLDEAWRTPRHFGCWTSASSAVKVKFGNDPLFITVRHTNSTSSTSQYRATIKIETDYGTSLKVMFCTEKAVKPGSRVGPMRLSGKYFPKDAQAFYAYSGRFSYEVASFERQIGTTPC